MRAARHVPVLLAEVLAALAPRDGETFVDGTFGAGGYTRAILEAAECRVLALDRDPTAIAAGQALVAEVAPRLMLVETPFSRLDEVVADEARGFVHPGGASPAPRREGHPPEPTRFSAHGRLPRIDGVVLDIGVSSMQLDRPERGFSFQHDGPLDMRMACAGPSAADFLNSAEEEEIANVIYEFGEEHRSRAIARAVVRRRAETPFATTRQLADLVLGVFHGRKEQGRHPATRTFQALRIHVNDELGELERGLEAAERVLAPGGRLAVVTFHSLEDRIVKQFLAGRSGKTTGVSRHLPPRSIKFDAPSFRFVNARPLTPSQGELDANPRSRSARLRAAVRTEAPPMAVDRAPSAS